MTTHLCHFSIDGEYITDLVRDLVYEGSWMKGANILKDGMDGMTWDHVYSILEVKTKLVGRDSEIHLEDEDDDFYTEYSKKLEEQLGCCFSKNGLFYQPRRVITSWGKEDKQGLSLVYESEWEKRIDFQLKRSQHYCFDNEIVQVVYRNDKSKCKFVVFGLIQQPPIFIKTFNTPDDAFSTYMKYHSYITEDGHQQRYMGYQQPINDFSEEDEVQYNDDKLIHQVDNNYSEEFEQQRWNNKIALYEELIKEQAKLKGGFFDLYVPEKNATYQIPVAPFMNWVNNFKSSTKIDKKFVVPDWECVSTPGMKMFGDDRFHTDWVIGAGIDPSLIYDSFSEEGCRCVNDAAYKYAFNLIHVVDEFNEMDGVPLVKNGITRGKIVFPTLNQLPEPGNIICIPHAGPEFDVHARIIHSKGGGAIITEVGGKLCHLATVGREGGYRMIMVPNAMEIFSPGMDVEVNSDTGEVKLYKLEK